MHPKFKLDWVDDEAEMNTLTDTLKRRLQSVETAANPSGTTANNKSTVDSISSTSTAVVKQDFFSALTAKRSQLMRGSINDVAQEVNKYFCDASSELSSLSNYPRIR